MPAISRQWEENIGECAIKENVFLDRLWKKKIFVIRILRVFFFFFFFLLYYCPTPFEEFPIPSFVDYPIIIDIAVTRFLHSRNRITVKHGSVLHRAEYRDIPNGFRSTPLPATGDRRSLTSAVNYITANDVRRESSAWNSNRWARVRAYVRNYPGIIFSLQHVVTP